MCRELAGQCRAGRGQYLDGQQGRVDGPRTAKCHGRNRYAGRHLQRRQQCVDAVQCSALDRNADHRQNGMGGQHATKVRRATGSGNIGATNVYRSLGRSVGVMTLVGDCLKAIAARSPA